MTNEELRRTAEEHPIMIFCIMVMLTIPLFLHALLRSLFLAFPEAWDVVVRFWHKEFLED